MNDTTILDGAIKLSGLNAIQVYASPLPFSNRQLKTTVAEGTSVYDIVDSLVPNGYDGNVAVIVTISGHLIPYENWKRIKPKNGVLLNIRVVPAGGGGGKNPLMTILSIAVAFAAPYASAALLSASTAATVAFGTVTYGQLLTTAISVVGRLAIAALSPPPKQRGSTRVNNPAESPTQFIEGAQNILNPYGVVPLNLGTNRMFPPQAARPYTETENNDNYVRQLFTWGYGKVAYSDLRIGETSLSEFNNVEIQDKLEGNLKEPTSLFSNSVFQEDMSILLREVDGYTVRQTQTDADEAIIDINFQGLVIFDKETGKKKYNSVEFDLQYSDVDTPTEWNSGIDFREYSGKILNVSSSPYWVYQIVDRNSPFFGDAVGELECAIFINKYSGSISLVEGLASRSIYSAIIGGVIPGPIVPPANSYRICSFTIRSLNGVISLINFSDDRNPSLFGSVFEDSSSFIPTVTGTKQVTVSTGFMATPIIITGRQTEPLRRSLRIQFPEKGQYNVRLRRVSSDTNSQYIIDAAYFSALKTVTYESPVNEDFVSGTAVRIKATDQLNGALNQFNAIVSSILPDYDADTNTWVERITSNPASLYRYVLQGEMNARALEDSKINITDLENWHTYCFEQNYSYNKVIDYETSLDEILRDIASAGSASPAIVDGKRTVVIDKIKDDIVQIITPRNSWGYEGEMIYTDIPDAFRVTFRNAEKGYQQDELIVYNDDFNVSTANLYETLDLQHCTNSDLAYKIARRYLASIKLRPEIHNFSMDVENLVALRGDRVKFVNDVSLIGVGDARIKEIFVDSSGFITGFEVDDTISIPSVGTYYVRTRLKDGVQLYKQINSGIGSFKEFSFTEPFENSVIDAGDLCYFTLGGQEKDLIILSIMPGSDLTAQISALDYAPEIFDAENSPIPAFSSQITTPLEFIRPIAPIVLQTMGDETVMQRNSDGSFLTRLVISLENQNSGSVTTTVKIRETGSTQFRSATVLETSPEQVIITGLQDGTRYDIHIRYRRSESNSISLPYELNNFLFIGASGLPNDVSTFKMTVIDGSALLSWDANTDIDISHYKIKFSGVFSGATWGTAQTLENKIYETRLSAPFQSGTYLIKAVDLTGNESENATAIITYDQGSIRNVVEELVENPDWLGSKENVVITDGKLTLAESSSDGYYYFNDTIDLGAVFISFVSSSVVSGGSYINNLFDEDDIFSMVDVFGVGVNDIFSMVDVFTVEDVFGIGNNAWEVQLQYRTTEDDTSGAPTWSSWLEFQTGSIEFRGIQFRLLLRSLQENITPLVSDLSVLIDMPDRIERGEDITVPVDGVTITYPDKFKNNPAVAITIQDGLANDEVEFITKTIEGFSFKVYNTTSASYVERTFDYISSGYGRE